MPTRVAARPVAPRWRILMVLFVVRIVAGYQYTTVAATAPLLMHDLAMSYAQLGLLIGLFDAPGVLLAFPAGLFGTRFGHTRVALVALGLMGAGGLISGVGQSYLVVCLGRLTGGAGWVLLNVMLTTMVTDWFHRHELVTALAVLMSSWPLGISLGLLTIGPLAQRFSWHAVMGSAGALALAGLLLIGRAYRAPAEAAGARSAAAPGAALSRPQVGPLVLAGLIWGLFNVAFVSLPNFAPAVLVAAGYPLAAASALVSVVTWLVIAAIPAGGYLAERVGRPDAVLLVCLSAISLGMVALVAGAPALIVLIGLGLLFGPPAGLIMALPAAVVRPAQRALGMGLFSTCAAAAGATLTALAGLSRSLTGAPAAPILFGALLPCVALLALGIFRVVQQQAAAPATR